MHPQPSTGGLFLMHVLRKYNCIITFVFSAVYEVYLHSYIYIPTNNKKNNHFSPLPLGKLFSTYAAISLRGFPFLSSTSRADSPTCIALDRLVCMSTSIRMFTSSSRTQSRLFAEMIAFECYLADLRTFISTCLHLEVIRMFGYHRGH